MLDRYNGKNEVVVKGATRQGLTVCSYCTGVLLAFSSLACPLVPTLLTHFVFSNLLLAVELKVGTRKV